MGEPITGAVVSLLVNQLYLSLVNEKQTLRGFKEDFERMKVKFDVITNFQADLQGLQMHDKDYKTIKGIVAGIRDLVYDADDILLDCQIRAAHEKTSWNSFLHGHTPNGRSFRKDAADKLREIQNRIEKMEHDLKVYLPAFVTIQRQMSEEGSSQGHKSIPRHTPHVHAQSKMIGLEKDKQKIIGWITAKERSRCIGIVGMGGMGKTTIAHEIFNNPQVVEHFHERIWVTVSQVFSVGKILKSVMEGLKIDVTDDMSGIEQALRNKNYLIVMDDVWDIDLEWWRTLNNNYLPEGENAANAS